MTRVLLTGATGFVGSALRVQLSASGFAVRAAVRRPIALADIAECVDTGDLDSETHWERAIEGVDCVIHTAARAHIFDDSPAERAALMKVNADGTARLAAAAAQAGVRRFIYLSSIKVNGEETRGRAYTAADEPQPQNVYGESKWLAEKAVRAAAAASAMQAVIVRSPLVYGPGVRANFLRLLGWVDKERPLPFGALANRRSLVGIWNLCDLLVHTVNHPAAADGTWLVSDGEDLATPDLIRRLARAMKRRARLVPVPVVVLRTLGALTGRTAEVQRLCGSLALDISATRERLEWTPPVAVDEGFRRTADWYVHEASSHER